MEFIRSIFGKIWQPGMEQALLITSRLPSKHWLGMNFDGTRGVAVKVERLPDGKHRNLHHGFSGPGFVDMVTAKIRACSVCKLGSPVFVGPAKAETSCDSMVDLEGNKLTLQSLQLVTTGDDRCGLRFGRDSSIRPVACCTARCVAVRF